MGREEVAEYTRWRFFVDGEYGRCRTYYDRITGEPNLQQRHVLRVLRDMGANSLFARQALTDASLLRFIDSEALWFVGAPKILVDRDTGKIYLNAWDDSLPDDAMPPDFMLILEPGPDWGIEELVMDVDLWDIQQKAIEKHWGFDGGAKQVPRQPPAAERRRSNDSRHNSTGQQNRGPMGPCSARYNAAFRCSTLQNLRGFGLLCGLWDARVLPVYDPPCQRDWQQ